MRGSGQIAMEARPLIEIVDLTLSAWEALDRKVFQSAWIICGYTTQDELAVFDGQARGLDRAAAHSALSDAFTKYSRFFVPQYCTTMEWQIKARGAVPELMLSVPC